MLDAIDRRGSFAAAAEELHRLPSAICYAIQKIEDVLQIRIFDRSGHRARLTETGRSLLDEGRHLLAHAHGIEERVHPGAPLRLVWRTRDRGPALAWMADRLMQVELPGALRQ